MKTKYKSKAIEIGPLKAKEPFRTRPIIVRQKPPMNKCEPAKKNGSKFSAVFLFRMLPKAEKHAENSSIPSPSRETFPPTPLKKHRYVTPIIPVSIPIILFFVKRLLKYIIPKVTDKMVLKELNIEPRVPVTLARPM